jgi:ketosteroid isomerase-like protein
MPDLKAAVAAMYEAFGRGDVPAILERLAPDVQWEDERDNFAQKAGVPWLAPRRGRDGAAEFFRLLSAYQFHEFKVVSLLEGDHKVVGEVVVELTQPNGVRVRDEELHLFTFNDRGQVIRFRHYVDTAKAIAAMKG